VASRKDKKAAGGSRLARWTAKAAPWAGLAGLAVLWLRANGREPPARHVSAEEIPALLAAAEPGRGRLAAAPPQIPPRGWRDVLWRTWHEVFRDRLPATAASVTFYTLLAIFPALGAFVSLYGLFADVNVVSRELSQLAGFVPADALNLIADQMMRLATTRSETLSFGFVVGLLISIWSANAGMAALFDGLNVVYEEQEKRNFLVRRLVTYGFTFLAVVFMTLTTAILVAVPIGLHVLGLGESLLVPLRWLALPLLAAVAFGVIYRYGPSRERARWRWVRVGAAVAAALWVAVSLLFSWYVNNLAHYDVTYGSLGAVVGFMVWIWLSVLAVLLGAELNAELEHQTARDSTTGRPKPLGRRGAKMADTVGKSFGGTRKPLRPAWASLRRALMLPLRGNSRGAGEGVETRSLPG
jgi:membrane protein